MWNILKRNWMALVAPSLAAGLMTATFVQLAAAPSTQTGLDCEARLADTAPLTSPDREWLERCVSAFSPRPTGTTPPATSPPVTTTLPGPTPTQPTQTWPNPGNTGVPAFWQPVTTRSTNLVINGGTHVVEDVLFTNGADLIINSGSVTLRRSLFQGGVVNNRPGSVCAGLTLNQVTFKRPTGTVTDADQEGTVRYGGYTANRVFMDGVTEGFRNGGCGSTTIQNTFIRVQSPDVCRDWHGDGIQGYGGGPMIIRNVSVDFQERGGCGGTAPFFYPRNQGNTSVDIDRLLVSGGGFSFRSGMPGPVRNLKIVNNSWGYGPIDVRCSVVTGWNTQIVTVDSAWQPTNVRAQACTTESGF